MELPLGYLDKLSEKTTGGPRSGWEAALDDFKARLDPDRIRAGYGPWTYARLARRLSNAGIRDEGAALAFYKKLHTEAKNFGKLFYTLTEPKTSKV